MNTPRGKLRFATPEATALELVGYANQGGGFDNLQRLRRDPRRDARGDEEGRGEATPTSSSKTIERERAPECG
jgi:hypothetical protein